ncbi:MAG: Rieske (2Fe-2S) protein [Actinomycetia bacterium]|nr:Rieske (2Fe-2S) protein [Actinomycetes bacterium]
MSEARACCSRRAALSAAGVAVAGVTAVGCSSAGQRASSAATLNAGVQEATEQARQDVAATSDVPVGGGIIVGAVQTVITQPTAGEFKAFSSICPHQGCAVSSVEDDEIICPCHDSRFAISTGAVLTGPARTGLTEVALRVDGESISLQ